MVKSNAQRQADYRERLKRGVNPDEVRRAARLLWESAAKHDVVRPGDERDTWDAFVARCHKKRGRENWRDLLRWMTSNPDDYAGDDFTEADIKLLAKVGAVMEAVFNPPAAGGEA